MKPYNEIQGWFNFEKTYNFLIETIPNGGNFVECGAWLGKSSAYLCDIAEEKSIEIFIVDNWLGSPNELDKWQKFAKDNDIYQIFLSNMNGRKFTTIKKFSHEAADFFQDNSCDVVFIDMNHSYESVKLDIETWLPKVKNNGYLAGHDYHRKGWPGVRKAVHELLGKENIRSMCGCWIYHKGVDSIT